MICDNNNTIEEAMSRVLVACEFSGVVRDAFRARGHEAWSCDLLPADGNHLQGDVSQHLDGWDLMIAHPPCTHLAVSGARWFKNKEKEQEEALDFVRLLLDAPIPKIALENPVSVISTRIHRPDQIIQPWMFGHGETKTTCLWLKGLPKLVPVNIVEGRENRIHKMPPSKNRGKLRSITYQGIADAMAMVCMDAAVEERMTDLDELAKNLPKSKTRAKSKAKMLLNPRPRKKKND